MKQLLLGLISFLFLFSCSKQNNRINDDCEICGVWNLDSVRSYHINGNTNLNPTSIEVSISSEQWIEPSDGDTIQIEMFPVTDSIVCYNSDEENELYYDFRGKYTLINNSLKIDGVTKLPSGDRRDIFFLIR